MRDFYWLLRTLGNKVDSSNLKKQIEPAQVVSAVEQHFGGLYFQTGGDSTSRSHLFKSILCAQIDSRLSLTRRQKRIFTRNAEALRFIEASILENSGRYPIAFVSSPSTLIWLIARLKKIQKSRFENNTDRIEKAHKTTTNSNALRPFYLKIRILLGSRFQGDVQSKRYKRQVLCSVAESAEQGNLLVMIGFEEVYNDLHGLLDRKDSILTRATPFWSFFDGECYRRQVRIHPDFRCLIVESASRLQSCSETKPTLSADLLGALEKHHVDIKESAEFASFRTVLSEITDYMRVVLGRNGLIASENSDEITWRDIGEQYIFCFQKGELLTTLALRCRERLSESLKRDSAENSCFLKYTIFFEDLVRYYSFRMFLMHFRFIEAKTENGSNCQTELDQLRELYLKSHGEHSLKAFLAKRDKPATWVVLTASRCIEYDLGEDSIVAGSRVLENVGSAEIARNLKIWMRNPEIRNLVFTIENKSQLKHLDYLLWRIDNHMQNIELKEKACKSVGVVVHFVDAEQREQTIPAGKNENDPPDVKGLSTQPDRTHDCWYLNRMEINGKITDSRSKIVVIEDLEQTFCE